jgi:hypothetical protein
MPDNIIDINLTEMRVHKIPEGMQNWYYYRIEYGGTRHECVAEEGIWLPPNLDEEDIENMLLNAQKKK